MGFWILIIKQNAILFSKIYFQSFGRCFSFSRKRVSFITNAYALEKKENLLAIGKSKKQLYMFVFLWKIADILVFINIS